MTAHRRIFAVLAAAAVAATVAGCSSGTTATATAKTPAATTHAQQATTAADVARWLHLTSAPAGPGDYFWIGPAGTLPFAPAAKAIVTVQILTPAQAASSYLANDVLNPAREIGVRVLGRYTRNEAVLHALQAQVNQLPPK